MTRTSFRSGQPATPARRAVLRLAGTGIAAALTPSVFAQGSTFPERPIQLVVPFSAGGATDVLARILAKSMEGDLKQPVVVQNRVGASGAIAAAAVAQAQPDGYTALFGGVATNIVLGLTKPDLSYRPEQDFAPVGNFCFVDFVMVTSAAGPYRTLADYLQDAKKHPGQRTYYSSGVGGTIHVAHEYLWKQAGVSVNHVAYKGESHVLPDLVAGRVDLALMTLSLSRQLVAEGKIRMLGTFSPERLAALPDLPTVAEQGFPGFAMPAWNGVFVPARTPADRVETLNRSINRALADGPVLKSVRDMGISPAKTNSVADYAAFLAHEQERWRAMITQSGIRFDDKG